MTYFTTTFSSINYSQLTTLYHIENQNVTFHPINFTTTTNPLEGLPPLSPYSFTEKIIIGIIAVFLVLCTVIGNFMVMISFKIDKQLQTISNYFLFSLAIADLAIGLVSMPLFTVQTIAGYWPFGSFICDTWLSLDYLASNASVLNLLIISFDRYFSVTRPLTYRAKRTNRKAAFMISLAWLVSLIIWPPWIYAWPYIEGVRKVPAFECYIQFIETNQLITFITAISAFYVPVTIMCGLYFQIWRETKKRQKDLPNLTAGGMSSGGGLSHHQSIKKDASKRSNSSDETSTINHQIGEYIDPNFWHPHSGDNESNSYYSGAHPHDLSRRTSTRQNGRPDSVLESIKNWCVAWWHSGQEEESFEDIGDWCDIENEQSYGDYGTPSSVETPVASSVSRCTSLNIIRDPYARGNFYPPIANDSPSTFVKNRQQQTLIATQSVSGVSTKSTTISDKLPSSSSSNLKRSLSQDSVYTILIRLPIEGQQSESVTRESAEAKLPSIKMYPEDITNLTGIGITKASEVVSFGGTLKKGEKDPFAINMPPHTSYDFNNRLPMNAKIIPRKAVLTAREKQQQKAALHKKKKAQDKRQESKAAKTLSAILLSFIVTWLPYNILVLIKPMCQNDETECVPPQLWDLFYALCYINSTINPVLYALCNASFRRTYIRILKCKWHSRSREGVSRGVYN